ncbi:hypothetical protein F4804DRAFT_212123 [Jackrogersella minutella]|nr:hypothetical protein F4804DRAFT_212123 [Jackrogersella minutella]
MGCSVLVIFASYLIHNFLFQRLRARVAIRESGELGSLLFVLRSSSTAGVEQFFFFFQPIRGRPGVLFFALTRYEYIGSSGSEFYEMILKFRFNMTLDVVYSYIQNLFSHMIS